MSVAPFLPGLLVPAPDAGTATGSSSDAQPGAEGEAAFMDALAAALAVLPELAPATPAASSAPGLANATTLPAELGVVPAELGVVTRELGVVTPELGVEVGQVKARAAESPGTSAPAVAGGPALETAVPASAHPVRQTKESAAASDAPAPIAPTRPVAAHGEAPGLPVRDDVLVARPVAATPGLEPTVTTPDSMVEVPNSAVTNPNSRVENPNSAVTNPKSVERAVVQQVFPEVTRLVSNGNGTHRITLTLQPAQLGEVRVTLVVRDGAVRVRMSGEAGDGAVRQALASGAPELQRMLERAGATEARVLVRDPFNPAAMPTTPAQAGRQETTGSWTGPDQFHQGEQFNSSSASGQSRGEGRDGRPGHQPGHPNESAGRPAAAAGVVLPSTPTAGRFDRNL